MSQNWTQEQLREHLIRRQTKTSPPCAPSLKDAASDEGDLQAQIKDYCNSKGWQPFKGSMGFKTRRTLGEPDFTIQLHSGLTIYVECKSRRGKRSLDQLSVAKWSDKPRPVYTNCRGDVISLEEVLEATALHTGVARELICEQSHHPITEISAARGVYCYVAREHLKYFWTDIAIHIGITKPSALKLARHTKERMRTNAELKSHVQQVENDIGVQLNKRTK